MAEIIFNYNYFYNEVCAKLAKCVDNSKKVEIAKIINDFLPTSKQGNINATNLESFKEYKNNTNVKKILCRCMGVDDSNPSKYFPKCPGKNIRPLTEDKLNLLDKYFEHKLPLYLNVNSFLKSLLLSSNLLIKSSNLKLCLSAMANPEPYTNAEKKTADCFAFEKKWTADEIKKECQKYADTKRLSTDKIKDCLEKYCNGDKYTLPKDNSEKNEGTKEIKYAFFTKITDKGEEGYVLNLTELIAHYNNFLSKINK